MRLLIDDYTNVQSSFYALVVIVTKNDSGKIENILARSVF